ncbi:hypothetical protein H0H93_010521 [Arthromyces matolae]|nr:hypothetical protein H0H93_010521 [Arthromyces matolae]
MALHYKDLDLFPAPSVSRSKLAPRLWPGITPESTATLKRIIKENHEKSHAYILGDYRAHNHSIQHTLAIWALGTEDDIIQAAYNQSSGVLVPRGQSPGTITNENLYDHLGDEQYYSAYVDFFIEVVKESGVNEAVEKSIFSENANFIPGRADDQQPEMLNRFLDGIIHSLIEVGYGLEFNIPGLVAEGLAWTAVHLKSSSDIIPQSFWKTARAREQPPDGASLERPILGVDGRSAASLTTDVHAFTILARILKDHRFDEIAAVEDYRDVYGNIVNNHSKAILEYVNQWTYIQSKPQDLERKIEELVYANALIYGVGGWSKNDEFNNDFFYAHLITSSIFLSTIAQILTPASQEIFLRSYFGVCLIWWIGRGRPGLDIAGFYAVTSENPKAPNAASPKSSSPNPWLSLLQETLSLPDAHLPKTHRALAHFAEIYGARKKAEKDFASTELEGAEEIDGSLFVRTALLTNERLRKERDIDFSLTGYWDRRGFYAKDAARRGVPEEIRAKGPPHF